jgi:hypothetical protein
MSRRTTLQRTLVATVAGLAVAASSAAARPIDRVDRFDNAAPQAPTDLRGEQALEAARIAEQKQEHFLPNQPTWPTHPAPAPKLVAKPSSPAPAPDSGIDDVWLIVGIGVAAAGLVGGSTAAAVRRSRVRARRVAV